MYMSTIRSLIRTEDIDKSMIAGRTAHGKVILNTDSIIQSLINGNVKLRKRSRKGAPKTRRKTSMMIKQIMHGNFNTDLFKE